MSREVERTWRAWRRQRALVDRLPPGRGAVLTLAIAKLRVDFDDFVDACRRDRTLQRDEQPRP